MNKTHILAFNELIAEWRKSNHNGDTTVCLRGRVARSEPRSSSHEFFLICEWVQTISLWKEAMRIYFFPQIFCENALGIISGEKND